MFCPKCGNQVQPNQPFCDVCGTPIAQVQPQPQVQPPQETNINVGLKTSNALPILQFISHIVMSSLFVLLIPFWFIHGFSSYGAWYSMSDVIAVFYTILSIIAFVASSAASILPIFKLNVSFNKNLIIQKITAAWAFLCFFLLTFNGATLTVWGVFYIIFVVGTVACIALISLLDNEKVNFDTLKNLTR